MVYCYKKNHCINKILLLKEDRYLPTLKYLLLIFSFSPIIYPPLFSCNPPLSWRKKKTSLSKNWELGNISENWLGQHTWQFNIRVLYQIYNLWMNMSAIFLQILHLHRYIISYSYHIFLFQFLQCPCINGHNGIGGKTKCGTKYS